MLFLVGTGLAKKDISYNAIEICKNCELFVDRYTATIDQEKLDFLAEIIGRRIHELTRSDLEEESKEIVERARHADIAVLVGGDPLIATTHKILFIEAKKRDVPVHVLHASSIASAIIGESGLDFYRFGPICTISRWSEKYKPTSFYETIQRNMQSNLHSLVLLDYDIETAASLSLKDTASILEAAEAKHRQGIITPDTQIFIMHNISIDGEQKRLTTFSEVKGIAFKSGMTAIILPGKISDIEREIMGCIYRG
ncbi:MAG TPA: diphthine synthase [Candidatus Baltobacteraceae bacterium]|nr:diphthine synthase [Candidatus Baltobacteraceae bacterium]